MPVALDPNERKRQRTTAVIVGFFGVLALGYGGYLMHQRFVAPFILPEVIKQRLNEIIPETEDERIARLKNIDTDNDKLSDYDETYVYRTNPYLSDSDSDGVSDTDEITKGDDPNCPRGQQCTGIRLVTPDATISDLFPQFSNTAVSLRDKTLKDFRKMLLDQGYDETKLAVMNDATLLLILEESLKLNEGVATSTATSTGTQLAWVYADYEKARALLIELGATRDEVNGLSNKEVEDIFRKLQ